MKALPILLLLLPAFLTASIQGQCDPDHPCRSPNPRPNFGAQGGQTQDGPTTAGRPEPPIPLNLTIRPHGSASLGFVLGPAKSLPRVVGILSPMVSCEMIQQKGVLWFGTPGGKQSVRREKCHSS